MDYTIAQIRQYIREVVKETKSTAHVDTGFLKRSIKGDWNEKKKIVEFREIFYGAYNDNAKLIQNAQKMMPKDLPWQVIFIDEEGRPTTVKGETRTGRTISRKSVTSGNASTNKIKSLITAIKNAKKKDDSAKGDRASDEKAP